MTGRDKEFEDVQGHRSPPRTDVAEDLVDDDADVEGHVQPPRDTGDHVDQVYHR